MSDQPRAIRSLTEHTKKGEVFTRYEFTYHARVLLRDGIVLDGTITARMRGTPDDGTAVHASWLDDRGLELAAEAVHAAIVGGGRLFVLSAADPVDEGAGVVAARVISVRDIERIDVGVPSVMFQISDDAEEIDPPTA